MSLATERIKSGRRPTQLVEMTLDYCSRAYGVAPCTAAIPTTGSIKCFNTLGSCQDTANYAKTTKTYRFCLPNSDLPPTVGAIPSIKTVEVSPLKADLDGGLGRRASVTITFQDHPHHDRGVDPYVTERTYTPEHQGTFWGKLRARNKYYQGRLLTVYSGYIGATFDLAGDFEARVYVIEKIEGPDAKGLVKVTAKDILKLADDDRAQAPKASSGYLSAALTAAATSLTLGPAGSDWTTEYPSGGGTVRIDSEVINYTARSTDTLTGITRGRDNTTAAAHASRAAVQLCLRFTAARVDDVLIDLFTDYTPTDAAYIPTVDWAAEADTWLAQNKLTALITEPTGVNTLVSELCQENGIFLWWDEAAQEIKLKAIAPVLPSVTVPELTESAHLIKDSIQISDDPSRRLSQAWVLYAKVNPTEDAGSNFGEAVIRKDTAAEGVNEHGDSRVKIYKSRWFSSGNRGQAITLASRTISRRRDNPRTVKFSLDAKDVHVVGDVVDVSASSIQDATGAAESLRVQIVEVHEAKAGTRYDFTAIEHFFSGRYCYIAPTGTPDYGSASTSEKLLYSFVVPSTGVFADGTEAYKVI